MKRIGLVVATLLLAAGLTGCAAPPKPLYHWGGYQAQVYEHFKGDGKGQLAQLAALEAEQQKARASGATLPPGYLAHMGLLSMKLGRDDDARRYWQAEKAQFPEAAPYLDPLLQRLGAPKS